MALAPTNCIIKKKNKLGKPLFIEVSFFLLLLLHNVLFKKNEYEELQHNLSLYQTPPMETISLEEFHELGYKRFKVLEILRDLKEKYKYGSPEFTEAFVKVSVFNSN